MYVITGATGRTGSVIANYLLEKGQSVRVIGRNLERLKPFMIKGAEAFVAEPTDEEALTKAFTGAKVIYVMLQPNYIVTSDNFRAHQDRIMDAIVPALEKAQIKYVVSLSSWGADKAEGTGPVVGLHQLEQRLNGIEGLNVLHLRAGYFMENTFSQIGNILNHGITSGPFLPDVKFPMISTYDIGFFAANAMMKLDFRGQQIHELQGQRDLSMNEASAIIGKAIGKHDLKYVQETEEESRRDMRNQGFSDHIIDMVFEVVAALNSGYVRMLETRSSQNSTTTSYEEFVTNEFVPEYKKEAGI